MAEETKQSKQGDTVAAEGEYTTEDNETFHTGAGSTVKGFKYFVEWGNKPKSFITRQSLDWRSLREALGNLRIGDWLRVPFEVTKEGYEVKQGIDRIRAAVYAWSGAAALEKHGLKALTHYEPIDKNNGVVWITIGPTSEINTYSTFSFSAAVEQVEGGKVGGNGGTPPEGKPGA